MLATEKRLAGPHELIPQEIVERLASARRRSDALFDMMRDGSLYERPIPERHRIIFYMGHLEAFDWNLLNEGLFGLKSVHPELDRLFAFGIDPIGGGLPADRASDWPRLEVVRNYMSQIRGSLNQGLKKAILDPDSHTRDGFTLATLLNVAIEHRLMHIETLAYMLHQLPLAMKVRAMENWQEQEDRRHLAQAVVHRAVSIPAGPVTLGLAKDEESFGWDNEYEAHTVEVPVFEIDQYKVTNRQYLDFMMDGGYETRALWADDDWNWKTAQGIAHPLFWKREGGRWLYRTMFEEFSFDEAPLALDWPVYVSQAEASAYAGWAGKSLPTEAEWQRAAYGSVSGETRAYPWGNEAADAESDTHQFGNFGLQRWDPTPVNAFPDGQSAFGIHDMLGNGWEWTSTVFGPFAGFKPFPFYRGYSADFFDGKHFVMKGGSARTARWMLRPSFRNWFQAHYQYVYAGFRCVSR